MLSKGIGSWLSFCGWPLRVFLAFGFLSFSYASGTNR